VSETRRGFLAWCGAALGAASLAVSERANPGWLHRLLGLERYSCPCCGQDCDDVVSWGGAPTARELERAWIRLGRPAGVLVSNALFRHACELDLTGTEIVDDLPCEVAAAPGYWIRPWVEDESIRVRKSERRSRAAEPDRVELRFAEEPEPVTTGGDWRDLEPRSHSDG